MTRAVVVLPAAQAEAAEASDWYRARRPVVADLFLDELGALLRRISTAPLQFAVLPTEPPFRRAVFSSFPYVLVFDAERDPILVVAVAHASRRPGYWTTRTSSS